MLRYLQNQPDRVVQNLQSRQDRRQPLVESHIDDGSDDLADLPDGASTGELVGDLSAGAACFRGRWCRRRLRRSCRGGVVEDTVEEEALGGRAVGGAW